jgi:putative ABC transport system substrate-binding protein
MKRREFITLLGGAAAACPFAASGQQAAIPMIGLLSSRSSDESGYLTAAFHRGLAESGYIDGRNVAVDYRWADGQYDRLPALAAEMVRRPIAVLVSSGGDPVAMAAKSATSTIPIVFIVGSDPVALGLVASYNRPGGNATGINILTNALEPKRLGLLRELVPKATTLAVLLNPNNPPAQRQLRDLEEAGRITGLQPYFLRASNDSEIEAAFESIVQQRILALMVAADPFFNTRRHRLVALAARHLVPAMYQFREYPVAGGLMSYGIDITEVYRQIGIYVSRILKGARVADLPVQQPTKFEFVINLKTAKALGVQFSDNMLSLADEVIE